MKKLILILLCSAAFGQTHTFCALDTACTWTAAQTFAFVDFQTTAKTVSTLPSAILNVGRMYRVTDGTGTSDCTVGGGSNTAVCVSNGATWQPMGGALNPTNLTIPVRSSGSFADSPLSVSGSSVLLSTTFLVDSTIPGSSIACGAAGHGRLGIDSDGNWKICNNGGSLTAIGGGVTGITGGNPVVFTNQANFIPGSTSTTSFNFGTQAANTGFIFQNSTGWTWIGAASKLLTFDGQVLRVTYAGNGGAYGFVDTGDSTGAIINQFSHPTSTQIVTLDTGTVGNAQGKLAAAGFMSEGTTFTASGCANSTLVGGATAGSYKSVTGGSCTVTITMGNSATAPNGWACDAHDVTTAADANNVTMGSTTTTTANLVEGTVAANDIIVFKCIGY